MTEPRPPATPPPVPTDATGEWSSKTAREGAAAPDNPTLTASGQASGGGDLGISKQFGRYAITRLLGRGGMGAVYLAHDSQLDRPVALKIPAFRDTPTPGQKERFFREARAVSGLHHPNICPVYDVEEEQGILYLTTAYISGQPLSILIDRGPMTPDKAVDLVRRVARAMQAAHVHGTIHRDLKPANIMIDPAGEPVVMDFGLARRAAWTEDSKEPGAQVQTKDQGLTQHGSVLGTPAYMPPEQALGVAASVGPQSDVYALGVILFELLTGRRPFVAADTGELIRMIVNDPPPRLTDFYPWIDQKIESACRKAMAKNPTDRFGTMAEFDRVLKEAVDPELTVVVPPPLPRPTKPKRAKRRWVKPVGCIGFFLLWIAICVGGPAGAVYWIYGKIKETVLDRIQSQQRAEAEWEAIVGIWQAPAADANVDVLFPVAFAGGYQHVRNDTAATDAELGIDLAGRRAIYANSEGTEVEIRVYRCPDAEAKAIQNRVESFVKSVKNGNAEVGANSNRKQVVYESNNSGLRTFTFGFADSHNLNRECGKLWYSDGWLFYFRCPEFMTIESFPSKYLMEVGKRANSPAAKKEK
jgi:serine/threonine protein kinase